MDPCDMCVLQGDDTPDADEDGCPDAFRLTDSCGLPPNEQARVARASKELARNTHMSTIRVVSGSAQCAAAVSTALQRGGVPAGRFEIATQGTGTSVSLEIGAWDGRRCPPLDPRYLPK